MKVGRRIAGLLALAMAALLPTLPALANTLPVPRVGTTILWTDGSTWSVTESDAETIEIAAIAADGTRDRISILDGVFATRQGGQTTRFDHSRLAALPPLEPGRVVNFDAEETGYAGTFRWFVHVAVAGQDTIEVPAGRFDVLLVEDHRRGPAAFPRQPESLVEWSVARTLGLPVAMRAWRIVNGQPFLTLDRRATAIGLP